MLRIDGMAFGFCVFFAVAIQSVCYADVTKLSTEDRRVLQDGPRFHEVHSIGDLPWPIVALCARDGHLGERGETWNPTDAIIDPALPKRLIWAAIGGDYYVVHYECGGIVHTYHLSIAKLVKTDRKPKLIWRSVGGPLKNYAAFLDSLRSGKFDDRTDYPALKNRNRRCGYSESLL
jgi:hypothetical protein